MTITARTVVVTGASGFLGRALLAHLGRLEIPVVALSRQERPDTAGVRWLRGDLADPSACESLIGPGDLVFHLGADLGGSEADLGSSIVDGTRELVRVAAHRRARFVHVSSLAVFPPVEGNRPTIIDEGSPIDPDPEHRGAYASAKIRAERIVEEAAAGGLEALVIRPAQLVGDGLRSIPPSLGLAAAGRRWSLAPPAGPLAVVHVDDAAAGLALSALTEGSPSHRRVHLVGGYQPTRRALLDRLRRAGVPGADLPLVDISPVAGMAAALLGRLGVGTGPARRLMAIRGAPEYPIDVATGMGWTPTTLEAWLAVGR